MGTYVESNIRKEETLIKEGKKRLGTSRLMDKRHFVLLADCSFCDCDCRYD